MNLALIKMEGRDPEERLTEMSFTSHMLVHSFSHLCSGHSVSAWWGGRREHVAPPRSHGLGEAGTETDHDSRGRRLPWSWVQGHRGAWGMVYQEASWRYYLS